MSRRLIPEDGIGRRPSVPLPTLDQPGVLDQFLGVFDWYLARIVLRSDL